MPPAVASGQEPGHANESINHLCDLAETSAHERDTTRNRGPGVNRPSHNTLCAFVPAGPRIGTSWREPQDAQQLKGAITWNRSLELFVGFRSPSLSPF